jgi:predicted phage tail protein/sulfur carrier protein ThiS
LEKGLSVIDRCSVIELPAAAAPASYDLALLPVRILEVRNPFRPEGRTETTIDPLENESVAAILARAGVDAAQYAVSVNGGTIVAADLDRTPVHPGDDVLLYPVPGGAKGAIEGFGILLMAASAVMTMGASALAGGAMWGVLGAFSASQIAMMGVAIGLGGSLLMSWAASMNQPGQPNWSATYDPTGPKGLAQPGVPVPKAYGKMGWCGNIVSSYVTYAGIDAYIYALACYGFGAASSITDILLNGKPISNYTGINYFTRLGSNSQGPIDGFNKTVNGFPQETQLLVANGPVVVSGTGTNVTGLEICCKLPGGAYVITHDGNYVPIWISYKIEYALHNTGVWKTPLFPRNIGPASNTDSHGNITWPGWVVQPTDRFAGSGIVYAVDWSGTHTPGDPWTGTQNVDVYDVAGNESTVSTTFTGEWQRTDPDLSPSLVTGWYQGYRILQAIDQTSALFDTVQIYGLAPGQYDVRVTKMGYRQDGAHDWVWGDSADFHFASDIWLWNINEVFLSDLAYPNMVLIGVSALATSQLSGANLTVQATITHDIGADTVLPTALVGFEHDNPAIVAYDVLANPLYGMAVPAAQIDVPAFVAWARFCDQTVTNQDSSTVRQFIFAGVFDQSSDAWQVLATIGNMSRAQVIQIGSRYTVVLDAPADPVQLFTVGNVIKDSFSEGWLSLDDRCTMIECDFADAARNYRMDLPVSVMTASDINSGLQPKITRTRLIGCTSRDQAWRWAYFHLLSTKLCLRTIQFSAAIEACCCARGSVIAFQSDVVKWAVGGRILAGSTTTALNIDRNDLTFATAAGWTVSVQHPVVSRGTATIATGGVSGQYVTCSAALGSARILKAIGPDGTEYIVEGVSGSMLTLSTAPSTLAAGQTISLYDQNVIDVLAVSSFTPTVFGATNGAVLGVTGSFSAAPTPDSAWAYGQSAGSQPAKLFRVTTIKRQGDFNFQIGAVEYVPDIYTIPTPVYGEIVETPNFYATIANLTLTELYANGTVTGSPNSSQIDAAWQLVNTSVGAQVSISANGGPLQVMATIPNGNSYTFTGTIGVTYLVSVYGMDAQGILGPTPATASITVQASTNAPGDVSALSGAFAGGKTVLTWLDATDAVSYEIRYNANMANDNWTNAPVMWSGTGLTWSDTRQRNGVYMIKAISSAQVESVNQAAWDYMQGSLRVNSIGLMPGQTIVVNLKSNTYSSGTETVTVIYEAPSQGLQLADGTWIQTTASSITWTTLPPDTLYYLYLFLDPGTFMLGCSTSEPSSPDTSANPGDLALCSAGGNYLALNTTLTTATSAAPGNTQATLQVNCEIGYDGGGDFFWNVTSIDVIDGGTGYPDTSTGTLSGVGQALGSYDGMVASSQNVTIHATTGIITSVTGYDSSFEWSGQPALSGY